MAEAVVVASAAEQVLVEAVQEVVAEVAAAVAEDVAEARGDAGRIRAALTTDSMPALAIAAALSPLTTDRFL